MISNFTELSETEYGDRRFDLLVDFEENGDLKELPYVDSEGIPTIGVGFNLRVAAVRDEVPEALGFDLNCDNQCEQGCLQQAGINRVELYDQIIFQTKYDRSFVTQSLEDGPI